MRFNTAISAMMILATEMLARQNLGDGGEKTEYIEVEDYKKFLQILAPFAPHITEELWQTLTSQGRTLRIQKGPTFRGSIHFSSWPKWDENLVKDQEITIAVQINGKARTEIIIQMNEEEEEVKRKALSNQTVLKYLINGHPKKIIYVKNRVINILP